MDRNVVSCCIQSPTPLLSPTDGINQIRRDGRQVSEKKKQDDDEMKRTEKEEKNSLSTLICKLNKLDLESSQVSVGLFDSIHLISFHLMSNGWIRNRNELTKMRKSW